MQNEEPKKIIFDETGLKPGTPYEKEQWRNIVSHNEKEIKGFFGEYRFLSNFWPAKVFLDGIEYPSVENAYQAAKYKKGDRVYFEKCSAKEATIFAKENIMSGYSTEEWDKIKLQVMKSLLLQKFDKEINPETLEMLLGTGNKFLEETNYWGDTFWGVSKSSANEQGEGENNLGKLLMEIRKVFF